MKDVEEIKTMNRAINIIFPHQLFTESELLNNGKEVYLIEEFLFFKQYHFHKQKIAFHRASMKYYQQFLEAKNIVVHYIEAENELADIRNFNKEIDAKNITEINLIDPTDYWLEKRIAAISKDIKLNTFSSPLFLNTKEDLAVFFKPEKKSFFQTTFYKQQRIKHKILLEKDEQPTGGKWTFDTENRKKYPKG